MKKVTRRLKCKNRFAQKVGFLGEIFTDCYIDAIESLSFSDKTALPKDAWILFESRKKSRTGAFFQKNANFYDFSFDFL